MGTVSARAGEPIDPAATHVNLEGDLAVADVEALRALPMLDALGLNFAFGVSDELVAVVGQLGRLVSLDLSCTDVTDAGVAHLVGLQRLAHLRIKETAIGDRACFAIAKLAALESLNLKQTRIGDVGLRPLAALSRLALLVLSAPHPGEARFTRRGVRQLRAALPACEIIVQGWERA